MSEGDLIVVQPVLAPAVGRWQPIIGPEAVSFLEHSVSEAARPTISDAAVSILAKGVPPDTNGQDTGLVVGYVQSGKTMSFETVAALAQDNGFQIVIVITGTSNPLFDQSTGRLRKDLRLDDPQRERRWMLFTNPDADDATVQPIRDLLEEWRDRETPQEFKRTALITVLKHHRRLRNLRDLMTELDLNEVPVLIIDDEADQASLNMQVAQNQESTTYRRLMDLRQAIPSHTYLQYTATPQAPLLINIIDSLSPNFVQVLEPGRDYVGGLQFFEEQSRIRVIPPQEVPTNANPLAEPPETLLQALRIFMVGVAAGILESNNTGNRSMLVHPSHLTVQHQSFYGWVRDIFDDWKTRLSLPDNDPDRQQLIEDFRVAHEDLTQTVGEALPSFEKLISRLSTAFRNTRVLEVNARDGATPQVDWRSMYGWILVGGQAMDRGFTVEGLTVTYMPRGVGIGNADTIQQRARFFGYKRPYFGYCRVYLEQGTLDAFGRYVTHEEDIRKQLKGFEESGRPLKDWKRVFLLDTRLRPCRDSVVSFDYMQGQISDSWVSPRVVLAPEEILEANRRVTTNFVRELDWLDDAGHADRSDAQRHQVCEGVPLAHTIAELLSLLRITGTNDTQRNLGLLLQLAKAVENAEQEEVCRIYKMSPTTGRERGVDEDGAVLNLYQGEAPVHPKEQRGKIYPGDRALHSGRDVTVQIHTLDLTRDGAIVARRVPVLAVWVPARLARGWVAQ